MSGESRNSRRITTRTIIALSVLLALYVGEYFWLSDSTTSTVLTVKRDGTREIAQPETTRSRTFDYSVLQSAYIPMAWVEAKVRKERVTLWAKKGGEPVLICP